MWANYAIPRTPAVCTAVAKWKSLLKGPVILEDYELENESEKHDDVNDGERKDVPKDDDVPKDTDVPMDNGVQGGSISAPDVTAEAVRAITSSPPDGLSGTENDTNGDPPGSAGDGGRHEKDIPPKDDQNSPPGKKKKKMTRKGSNVTNQNRNVYDGLRKKGPSQQNKSDNNNPKKTYNTRATSKNKVGLRATNSRKEGAPPPAKNSTVGGKDKKPAAAGKKIVRRDTKEIKHGGGKGGPRRSRLAWKGKNEEEEALLQNNNQARSSSTSPCNLDNQPKNSAAAPAQEEENKQDGDDITTNGEEAKKKPEGLTAELKQDRPASGVHYGQVVEHKKVEVVKTVKVFEEHHLIAAIPRVPLPIAVICCLFNIFAPGTGRYAYSE